MNRFFLRQFLYMGARDYKLEMYQKGRISLSRAAELMDTSTFEILRLAKELKIHTGATEEQQKKSRETTKKLKA